MNKIDKLITALEELELESSMHMITDGYCRQCHGECHAAHMPGIAIILNDVQQADTAAEQTKEEFDIDPDDIPGLSSLTRAEREEILRDLQADPEHFKRIVKPQAKYKYRDLFGWG